MSHFTHNFTTETAAEYFDEPATVAFASIRLMSPVHALAKLLAGKRYSVCPDALEEILAANGFTTNRPYEIEHAMKEFYKGFQKAHESVYGKITVDREGLFAICLVAGVQTIYKFQMTDPDTLARIDAAERGRKRTMLWVNVGLTIGLTIATAGVGAIAYGVAARLTSSAIISAGAGAFGSAVTGCAAIGIGVHFNRHNN